MVGHVCLVCMYRLATKNASVLSVDKFAMHYEVYDKPKAGFIAN